MEDWKFSLDNKNVIWVLSSDLSKVFDSLFRPLLLAKLKKYGFSDSALGLLRSFFSERKNRVRIGKEVTSEWREISKGCPQGSNFGPLIWNIYQNGTQKQRNKELNISIMNNSVKITCQMKLLGVTFDDQLKFNTHIEELSKKAARKVGVLLRL